MDFDFSDIEPWSREVTLKDGARIQIRAERKSDLEPLWTMYSTLSEESLRNVPDRYTRELVTGWVEALDYERSLPILAFDPLDRSRVAGCAILHFSAREETQHKAEFGIVVHDDYQGRGLGTILTRLIVEIGRAKGLRKIGLTVYAHNEAGIHVYRKCGFEVEGLLRMEHWHHLLEDYVDAYRMGVLL
jgi:RimJ/RimL family protein N-acetyltransferase